MLNVLRAAGLAGALALAPAIASAVTLNPSNNVVDGGSYDIFTNPFFFGAAYNIGDAGDTYTFTFTNTSSTSAALTFTGVTFLQNGASFSGGASAAYDGTPLLTAAAGTTTGGNFTTTLAAGDSTVFTIDFGNVVNTPKTPAGGNTGIQFSIEAAAVPLPAAGLLLLGGLGGLAVVRRRRKAA